MRSELDSRNHNIETKGVPLSENDDVLQVIRVVARVLGMGFSGAEISIAHRL